MSEWISTISQKLPSNSIAERCDKDGCSVQTSNLPSDRIIIDLDSRELQQRNADRRCDYLVVADDGESSSVIPLELKSGGFQATSIIKQLQAGADRAREIVPHRQSIKLVPVLAHNSKQRIHREDLKILKTRKIKLFKLSKKVVLSRCGDDLSKHI